MEFYERQAKDLTEWKEDEILEEVRKQFIEAQTSSSFKKRVWVEYMKLYLNQERKRVGDLLIGSNLLYTQFNELYSSIDNDNILVNFRERNPRDAEKVQYTNAVARFDFDEMSLGTLQRELYWDLLFYGTGIYDVSEYDNSRKVTIVRIQSPFTFFVDPLANNIDEARFAGRYIYMTAYELLNDERIDESQVKKILGSSRPSSIEKLQYEERAKNILLLQGINYAQEEHSLAFIEVLEWYFYANGKLWVVWTDNAIKTLLGFKQLDYQDGGNKKSKIPFVVYYFSKSPRGFWGIGVPDILETHHRTATYLLNLYLQGIKLDATTTFLANLQAIHNPKDLMTRELNKIIWTKVPPVGQIASFPKTQVISNDTLAFYQLIQNEALGAIGASRILRGSLTAVKKTATEIAVAKAKQDLQIASYMRNVVRGEQDFWNRWLKRHKKFMKLSDRKLVELIGFRGARQFTEVSKEDFIPVVDPIIEVASSLISEPAKIVRRRDLAEMLPIISQLGGNVKAVTKMILRDLDLTPEQIDIILPPTPHQIKARRENELLANGVWVDIDETDDDLEHIEEHSKVRENEVVRLHIEAHQKAYLLKQGVKEKTEKIPSRQEEIEEPEMEEREEVEREMLQETPLEGLNVLRQFLEPKTPGEVK